MFVAQLNRPGVLVLVVFSVATVLATQFADDARAQEAFTPEALGQVEQLPMPYPNRWLLVHDFVFDYFREGRIVIVDPLADTLAGEIQGMLSADFAASIVQNPKRGEIYIAETFFARGGRGGKRTDVVTIWDSALLEVKGEVVIPAKRLNGLPTRFQFNLIDERFLVVYNFTPAQSVTVVDLVDRKVVGEISIAGCAFTIPTGRRGFSSLCSDGGLLTTRLKSDGTLRNTVRLEPFNDIENDAMMEKPALIGGIAYFPTFTGNVVPIDLRRDRPKLLEPWSLVSTDERQAGWRPGGVQVTASDNRGRLYVLMHPDGKEGTHKDGGGEVWVFDPKTGERENRITLPNWGISLVTTDVAQPQLVVVNGEMKIELYDPIAGELVKTLAFEGHTPLQIHSVAKGVP